MRGEQRTKPGDIRPAAGAMALFGEGPDMALAAFGAGDAYDVLNAAVDLAHDDGPVDARAGRRGSSCCPTANGVASVLR